MNRAPIVLLIDDEPNSAPLPEGVSVVKLNPGEGAFGSSLEAELPNVDIILLDQNLNREQKLGLDTLDGASFVGNLRSWARAKDLPLPPLVIYTSEYDAFQDEIPALGPAVPLGRGFVGQEARIAPALDVEWLLPKFEDYSVKHLSSLAHDCLALKLDAGDARMSLKEILKFLDLPSDEIWSDLAREGVTSWRPPISEAGDSSPGSRGATPVLRWLLHRVLPCPGLLLSDLYAAWSLGVRPGDFSALADSDLDNDWLRRLRASRYTGAARDLCERKWWAAGIDFVGWQLRSRADELGSFSKALEESTENSVRSLDSSDLVVAVNSDMEEVELVSIEDAVQINPPGWPAEALEPWMERKEFDNDPIAQTMATLYE